MKNATSGGTIVCEWFQGFCFVHCEQCERKATTAVADNAKG